MPERKKMSAAGIGWLVVLALPPVLVLAGLVAMFAWQASKGGVSPKWKKPPVVGTNTPVAPPPP